MRPSFQLLARLADKANVSNFLAFLLLASQVYAQSGSRVELRSFYSNSLQTEKSFRIYLPAGYDSSTQRYPVVYFLRNHEIEWFTNGALQTIADNLIASNEIGPMILVGPSTTCTNGSIWALGVNLLRTDLTNCPGIGTGRFEDYFLNDLIPHVDSTARTIADRNQRGIDGFSLGGYTALTLALRNPGYFKTVGSYDGTLMWLNFDDPDIPGSAPDDPIWIDTTLFGTDRFKYAFDYPRNISYMLLHNVSNIIAGAGSQTLARINHLKFFIHTSNQGFSGGGNRDRGLQLVSLLLRKGISNGVPNTILDVNALHTWSYAQVHATRSLVRHWQTFQGITEIAENLEVAKDGFKLHQNYPNPFNPTTTIEFAIPKSSDVSLKIFDVMGREVATLVNQHLNPGTFKTEWDASDVASGIYFYRLQSGESISTKKLMLLR